MMAHQIWFCAKSCSGRLVSPVSFAQRMRVLGSGAAAVPQLEVGQLTLGRVGGERGHPVPVGVGES
jgi:hypothetical protein